MATTDQQDTFTFVAGPNFLVLTENGETLLSPISTIVLNTKTVPSVTPASSTATISAGVLTLNLNIPKGDQGEAATIIPGKIIIGDEYSLDFVNNSDGTQTFNITIPDIDASVTSAKTYSQSAEDASVTAQAASSDAANYWTLVNDKVNSIMTELGNAATSAVSAESAAAKAETLATQVQNNTDDAEQAASQAKAYAAVLTEKISTLNVAIQSTPATTTLAFDSLLATLCYVITPSGPTELAFTSTLTGVYQEMVVIVAQGTTPYPVTLSSSVVWPPGVSQSTFSADASSVTRIKFATHDGATTIFGGV